MRKKLYCLFILLLPVLGIAQQNQLTLEDAVLKQYSDFYPSNLIGLQWIKGKTTLSWLSPDYKSILQLPGKGGHSDTLLKLSQLNVALDLDLNTINTPHWLSSSKFYFKYNNAYYTYDIPTGTGEQWLDIPLGRNLSFNENTKAFAYTIDNNLFVKVGDQEEVAITEFEDPNIVAGQSIARNEFGIGKGIFWAPNGQSLAFYQKDESDVADYPILDITTTPGSLKSIKYPMAGQKSEYASIGIYNLKTNKTLYLQIDGPKEQYLTNLAWGPAGRYVYVAVLNRDQNHMWLNKYNAQDGTLVNTLFEERHPKYVEPEQAVWFIPGEDDHFLWFSERDGFNHLYRYDVNGNLLNRLTEGNWEAQEILGLDETGKNVLLMGTDESGLNRYLYSSDLDKPTSRMLSKASGIHRFSLSDNGRYLTDSYSNAITPRKIDLIDSKGKLINKLLTAENPLEKFAIGEASLLDLKSADGTLLHARIIKPSHFSAEKKYPVLCYVYGGPHAQMVSNRWLLSAPLWMYYFAEQGYIIFTLDNRGSGNRGFAFENIIHRNLGEVEIQDQLTGIDYLKSLDYIDSTRMAVHGWSYGGFMATSMMLKTPGVFQVGVAGGPVTDWKYYEVMYGERYMDRPEENPEGYKKTSLLNKADRLEGKLLLIHGTSDNVVVMQHSLSLIRAFINAGKQVDFFPYPMHKHNVRGKDRLHLMTKILNYIEKGLMVKK